MKSLFHRCLLSSLAAVLLILTNMGLAWAQVETEATSNEAPPAALSGALEITVIAFLLLMIVGVFVMLYILQKHFLNVCKETGNLQLFSQTPFGVPEGTIRSILALSIVFASICYLTMSMLNPEIEYPKVMVGILGSVLGFYFGSRGSSGRANEEVIEKLGRATKDRDDAVENAKKGKLSEMVAQAKNGVAIVKTLSKVLPKEMAKKLNGVVNAVDKGIEIAEGLAGAGQTKAAISEVEKTIEKLNEGNPVKEMLLRVVSSFGSVLGSAVPPLAIASIVIAIGSKLAGAAYNRWVARVLAAPYTPELFPPTVIDSAVAMSIAQSSPIFSLAFKQEIKTGDLATIRDVIRRTLTDHPDETLWGQPDIAKRFVDQATMDQAIEEVQRAAMTEEVIKDIDPVDLESAGGLDQFIKAIDKINADENAQGDLDALVLMMDELKKENQPVEQVFKEAQESLRQEDAL